MNKQYYTEKANKLKRNTETAVQEVERFFNNVSADEITLIEEKANTQNQYWINVNFKDPNKAYYTKRMNKDAYKIFLNILPLNEHEKIEDRLIPTGTIANAKDEHNIFTI